MESEAVRKVVTRTGRGMRCLVPSLKMKRMIECESMLEADAVLLFDWSPDVVSYQEQPCTEHPHADGVPFRYTPDFRLTLINGSHCFVEVKPARRLLKAQLRKRMNFVAEHFERSGRDFRILTELEIRKTHIRDNQRRLNYHSRNLPVDFEFWNLVELLTTAPGLTLGQACAVIGDRRDVMRLLANQCFEFDLSQPLTDETPLQFVSRESRHATFQV